MTNFTGIPALDSSKIMQFNGSNSKEFVGIQELRLTCPIGDRGASLISDGLESNSSLLSLSLVNCNISTAGLGDIFSAVTGDYLHIVTKLTIFCLQIVFKIFLTREWIVEWKAQENRKDSPTWQPLALPIDLPGLFLFVLTFTGEKIEGQETGYDYLNWHTKLDITLQPSASENSRIDKKGIYHRPTAKTNVT